MTLFEIDQQILDCVDMETGEILDLEKLDSLQMEKKEKIGNVAAFIKNLVAESKALKEEEDILAARRRACDNKVKRLKDYLQESLNGEKFKDSRVSIYYGKTAPSVKFAGDDEKAFIDWAKTSAPEYLTYSEPTVNKARLKEDISSGLEFSLASLEQSSYIVIK